MAVGRRKVRKSGSKRPKTPKPQRSRSKAGSKPALLTRRELAAALSVGRAEPLHMQTITKWEQEGLPVAHRGGKGRASLYREADVRAWVQMREEASRTPGKVNLVEDRARKERAQAALAEQAYQIRMRDLLPRQEVEALWAAEIAAVRTKLLGIPAAYSDPVFRLATTDGLGGVERALTEAVYEVLRELADPHRPVPGTPPSTGGQGVPAAA